MHFDLIMFSPVVNVFVLAIAVPLLIIFLINISMGPSFRPPPFFFFFFTFLILRAFHNWRYNVWMMNLFVLSWKSLVSDEGTYIYHPAAFLVRGLKLKTFCKTRKLGQRMFLRWIGALRTHAHTHSLKKESHKKRKETVRVKVLFNHLKTQKGMKWNIWDK